MQAPRTTLQLLRFSAADTARLQPLAAAGQEQLCTDILQLHANAQCELLRSSSTWCQKKVPACASLLQPARHRRKRAGLGHNQAGRELDLVLSMAACTPQEQTRQQHAVRLILRRTYEQLEPVLGTARPLRAMEADTGTGNPVLSPDVQRAQHIGRNTGASLLLLASMCATCASQQQQVQRACGHAAG